MRLGHNSDIMTANIYLRALARLDGINLGNPEHLSDTYVAGAIGVNAAWRGARDSNGTAGNLFLLDVGKPRRAPRSAEPEPPRAAR